MDSSFCRMCVKPVDDFVEIFSAEGQDQDMPDTISQYFEFKIREDDEYSHIICNSCWNQIDAFRSFVTRIQRIQSRFFYLPNENSCADWSCDVQRGDDETVTLDGLTGRFPFKEAEQEAEPDVFPKPVVRELSVDPVGAVRDAMDVAISKFYKFECQECSIGYEKLTQVRKHMLNEHQDRRGYMGCCKRRFHKRSDLVKHMMWHTDPNHLRCDVCPDVFRSAWALKVHQLNHIPMAERHFACDMCDKRFAAKSVLYQHMMQTHRPQEERKFGCTLCDKRFTRASVLSIHVDSVHRPAGMPGSVCDICNKGFKGRHTMLVHRAKHSKEKREELKSQCNECKKWLRDINGLRRHIKNVHQAQPQKCPHCERQIRSQNALRLHIAYMHTKDRSHKCTLCDKAFKRPNSLNEHMAIHSETNLYVCDYCPKTFKSCPNKYTHQRKEHYEDWKIAQQNKRKPISIL